MRCRAGRALYRAHGDVRQQPDRRGDDEPAIQTRGQVGRASRPPPGTAGSAGCAPRPARAPGRPPTSQPPQRARLALGRAGCTDCSPGKGNLRRCVSIATAKDRVDQVTLGARFRHPQFAQWLTQLVGGQRLGASASTSSGSTARPEPDLPPAHCSVPQAAAPDVAGTREQPCRGAHCAAAGGQPTRNGSDRELGGRAFRNCELLRFPIDYVTQAVSDVSTEPRIARARPLGCPLSRRLHR